MSDASTKPYADMDEVEQLRAQVAAQQRQYRKLEEVARTRAQQIVTLREALKVALPSLEALCSMAADEEDFSALADARAALDATADEDA